MRKLMMSFGLVFSLVGCVSSAAIQATKDAISVNKGHMADASLPQQAREIGQDNYDLDCAILYNLDGTALPSDVAARKAARASTAPVAS